MRFLVSCMATTCMCAWPCHSVLISCLSTTCMHAWPCYSVVDVGVLCGACAGHKFTRSFNPLKDACIHALIGHLVKSPGSLRKYSATSGAWLTPYTWVWVWCWSICVCVCVSEWERRSILLLQALGWLCIPGACTYVYLCMHICNVYLCMYMCVYVWLQKYSATSGAWLNPYIWWMCGVHVCVDAWYDCMDLGICICIHVHTVYLWYVCWFCHAHPSLVPKHVCPFFLPPSGHRS